MPGTYSLVKTVVAGETITASDRNAEHTNHIANADPDGIGDASADVAEMQATTDPYPATSESLATNERGELQRLRYLIKQITGQSQWYIDPDTNILLEFNRGADIASATALTLGTDGNYFDVTGSATIETIGTRRVGSVIRLGFVDDITLVHSVNLQLQAGGNITTVAGDIAEFLEHETGKWRLLSFKPYDHMVRTKVINIGDWNMVSTANKLVAHGLTLANIRSVNVTVRNDADTVYNPVVSTYVAGGTEIDLWIAQITATNVSLNRRNGSTYDDVAFDSTSYNRGWVIIIYVV
ncbi:MAG: hypothetical protein V3U75_01315 [Methylococcaceae bacterium]